MDAYNRRDIDALCEELDPEIEWLPALPGLMGEEAAVYRGHDGMRTMFHDLYEVLDEIHFDVDEMRDLGDRVVAIGHIRVRGKASGAETRAPYVNVADLRDGKGIRIAATWTWRRRWRRRGWASRHRASTFFRIGEGTRRSLSRAVGTRPEIAQFAP